MRQNSPSHRVVAASRSLCTEHKWAPQACRVPCIIESHRPTARGGAELRWGGKHQQYAHIDSSALSPLRMFFFACIVSFLCCRSCSRNECQRWWRRRILACRQRLWLAQPFSRAPSVAQRERISFLHTTSALLFAAHDIRLCPIPSRLLSSSVPTASLWQPTLHLHHPGPWATSLMRR